jgi:hypothetical protein
MILPGDVQAAAIDSTVLEAELARNPAVVPAVFGTRTAVHATAR